MNRRLDIDALRALQAIAVHGGVTRAADHLALSQSAVSHKIKRLEDAIGCNLLSRRAGAPLLSEAGARLLSYANRILTLHDEALRSLSVRDLSGAIRLGMTEDMTSSGLARILGRFTRLFPAVSVRTHVAQSLTLQKRLADGAIDIAVMQVFSQERLGDDLALYEDRLVWAKAIDMVLDWDRPIPFLAYDDACFYKRWMLEQTTGPVFETVLQCTSNAGVVAAVEAGLGVAIINRRRVSGTMTILDEGFAPPPPIAYVVRKSAARSKAVDALAEEVFREAADIAARDAALSGGVI